MPGDSKIKAKNLLEKKKTKTASRDTALEEVGARATGKGTEEKLTKAKKAKAELLGEKPEEKKEEPKSADAEPVVEATAERAPTEIEAKVEAARDAYIEKVTHFNKERKGWQKFLHKSSQFLGIKSEKKYMDEKFPTIKALEEGYDEQRGKWRDELIKNKKSELEKSKKTPEEQATELLNYQAEVLKTVSVEEIAKISQARIEALSIKKGTLWEKAVTRTMKLGKWVGKGTPKYKGSKLEKGVSLFNKLGDWGPRIISIKNAEGKLILGKAKELEEKYNKEKDEATKKEILEQIKTLKEEAEQHVVYKYRLGQLLRNASLGAIGGVFGTGVGAAMIAVRLGRGVALGMGTAGLIYRANRKFGKTIDEINTTMTQEEEIYKNGGNLAEYEKIMSKLEKEERKAKLTNKGMKAVIVCLGLEANLASGQGSIMGMKVATGFHTDQWLKDNIFGSDDSGNMIIDGGAPTKATVIPNQPPTPPSPLTTPPLSTDSTRLDSTLVNPHDSDLHTPITKMPGDTTVSPHDSDLHTPITKMPGDTIVNPHDSDLHTPVKVPGGTTVNPHDSDLHTPTKAVGDTIPKPNVNPADPNGHKSDILDKKPATGTTQPETKAPVPTTDPEDVKPVEAPKELPEEYEKFKVTEEAGHNGISQVVKLQMLANHDLAEKLGFPTNGTSAEQANFLRHFLQERGYINSNGLEIRETVPGAAYIVTPNGDMNEYGTDSKFVETHIKGTKFETDTENYEETKKADYRIKTKVDSGPKLKIEEDTPEKLDKTGKIGDADDAKIYEDPTDLYLTGKKDLPVDETGSKIKGDRYVNTEKPNPNTENGQRATNSGQRPTGGTDDINRPREGDRWVNNRKNTIHGPNAGGYDDNSDYGNDDEEPPKRGQRSTRNGQKPTGGEDDINRKRPGERYVNDRKHTRINGNQPGGNNGNNNPDNQQNGNNQEPNEAPGKPMTEEEQRAFDEKKAQRAEEMLRRDKSSIINMIFRNNHPGDAEFERNWIKMKEMKMSNIMERGVFKGFKMDDVRDLRHLALRSGIDTSNMSVDQFMKTLAERHYPKGQIESWLREKHK